MGTYWCSKIREAQGLVEEDSQEGSQNHAPQAVKE